MPIVLVMLVLGIVQFAMPAHALRCGTRLVREGDTRERVRDLCGSPTDVTQRVEERGVRQSLRGPPQTQVNVTNVPAASTTTTAPSATAAPSVPVVGVNNGGINNGGVLASALMVTVTYVVESWTYNFGPDRAMQRVVFVDGLVDQIESLGRGYATDAPTTDTPVASSAPDNAVADRAQRRATRLVREGDSRDQVAAAWGEPTEVTESIVERTAIQRVATGLTQRASTRVRIERWVYNFGPLRLMQAVVIEDGRVVEVASLGMGY